ncbi:MAG: alpha/beta hydrolase [Solirubrobacteraceae bacterium]|nr:alpha/beta hydrolase [Solirubrobacteraceae bacterium]
MHLERGEIGRLPCLAAGSGRPLLYLSGLMPQAGVDGLGPVAWACIGPLARHRRVLFVNRRRGLPPGTTMAGLAAEHAEAIAAAFGGPVDVLGVSTGGSLAQQLAADHPQAVRRLVLVSSGCRLGPEARALQRRVVGRLRRGADRRALAVLAASVVPPALQVPAALAGWLAGPAVARAFGGFDDLAATLEAEDGFDLAACPRPIRAPTLIVAGDRDADYPRAVLEETARLIPGSRLLLRPRRGHATALFGPAFTRAVVGFLDEPDAGGAQARSTSQTSTAGSPA